MEERFTYDNLNTALVGLSHRGSRLETPAAAAMRQPYGGSLGVFAVNKQEVNGCHFVDHLHYVYKDHLGSWTTITDTRGRIEQEVSFDAWGNPRDPDTWSGEYDNSLMFDRGFTGHEHLYDFGLINMNGRMYDPVMSSFLSVDNYVQQPDNSQNFNRYAYCLNNPLKYTDPSGEAFGIFAAMVVGSMSSVIINGIVNSCSSRNFYDGSFGAFMGGAASAAMGGIMGGAAASLVGGTDFVCGGVVGASGGLAGGYVGGYVGTWCNGGSPQECMAAGIIGGAIGLGSGFVIGGIQGGIYAAMNGGNFWSGAGVEYARFTDPSTPWNVEMQEGMEYSTDFLNRFEEVNGLDLDAPSNLNESFADGVTISEKSRYHYKGSWLTDSKEVERVYATTINIGFGKYNTYYAQAAFVSPEELYLTINHEYFHMRLYAMGYTDGSSANKDFHHASISRYEYDQALRWNYRTDYFKSVRDSYKSLIARGKYVEYSDYFILQNNIPIIPR